MKKSLPRRKKKKNSNLILLILFDPFFFLDFAHKSLELVEEESEKKKKKNQKKKEGRRKVCFSDFDFFFFVFSKISPKIKIVNREKMKMPLDDSYYSEEDTPHDDFFDKTNKIINNSYDNIGEKRNSAKIQPRRFNYAQFSTEEEEEEDENDPRQANQPLVKSMDSPPPPDFPFFPKNLFLRIIFYFLLSCFWIGLNSANMIPSTVWPYQIQQIVGPASKDVRDFVFQPIFFFFF